MPWWQTALVSLVGALVGGGLTAFATFTVSRRQERAALAREVRRALAEYFGALVIAIAQIQRMPEEAPTFDVFREIAKRSPPAVRRWIEAERWISTETRMRRTLGPEPFAHVERVILAHAPLHLLPLPESLRKPLDDSLSYIEDLARDRSEPVRNRWSEVNRALTDAIRAHVIDPDELLSALRRPEPR